MNLATLPVEGLNVQTEDVVEVVQMVQMFGNKVLQQYDLKEE